MKQHAVSESREAIGEVKKVCFKRNIAFVLGRTMLEPSMSAALKMVNSVICCIDVF